MKISKVMSRSVATCSPEHTLHAVAQAMVDNDCGCLPVVDSDGRPIGILTDRDICIAACATKNPLRAVSVVPVMNQDVHTCSVDDDLRTAVRLMREHKIRRLPVVEEDGKLAGIVSLGDLARAAPNGAREEVARALAEICTPSG